ncbi:MAG: hypothetical protein AAB777_00875 [Patescibacteria group bacterium]
MNTDKKSNGIIIAVIAVIIIIAIVWIGRSSKTPAPIVSPYGDNSTTTPVLVSETTNVSSSLSEYQNAELGFSVKYPSVWEKGETNSGITFVVPLDKAQVSTVRNLQANIQVISAICEFPPVTTIKNRSTVKVSDLSFNTISMSNTVQGLSYFNRMYSLQKGSICYMFSLQSITKSPSNSGLTGSQATQATNNNKAIVNSADTAFIEMVKSFAFVTGPQGQDETTVAPIKK